MTSEERNELRQFLREEVTTIIRGEIAAAEQRISERQDRATAILREEIAAAEQRMIERQDRAVEALTTNLSEAIAEIRQEIRDEISPLRREIATMRERLDNFAVVVASVDARMGAFTRSIDRIVGEHDGVMATLDAQKRAIDHLSAQLAQTVARVEALERKAG
jgi:chromosome segregation ATPase